ncbi:MAG: methyltransferase domain-containing protein [Chitinispirillaceae bacterium]|nr:methyltransferase domain-containing protein [Chitinispirillaceae bacterium]
MVNRWDDLWSVVREDFNELSPSQRQKYRLMHRLFNKYGLSGTGFDVGCGNGATLNFLRRYCSKLYGIDGSTIAIQQTRHKFPEAVLFHGDITIAEPPLLESCDVVTCVNMLEEVEDTDRALSFMASLVKPGGHLCIVTQHSERYRSKYDDFAGNVRRFELPHLRRGLQSRGLCIRFLRTWGFPLYTIYYSLVTVRNPANVWTKRRPGEILLSSIINTVLPLDDYFTWCNRGRIIIALCQKVKAP